MQSSAFYRKLRPMETLGSIRKKIKGSYDRRCCQNGQMPVFSPLRQKRGNKGGSRGVAVRSMCSHTDKSKNSAQGETAWTTIAMQSQILGCFF